MTVLKAFIAEEDGVNTIEVAVILAIMVTLAVLLRGRLFEMWGVVSGSLSKQTMEELVSTATPMATP
jgi:Flp pilus assembly pilin Flp